jgi:hypothetical protein
MPVALLSVMLMLILYPILFRLSNGPPPPELTCDLKPRFG